MQDNLTKRTGVLWKPTFCCCQRFHSVTWPATTDPRVVDQQCQVHLIIPLSHLVDGFLHFSPQPGFVGRPGKRCISLQVDPHVRRSFPRSRFTECHRGWFCFDTDSWKRNRSCALAGMGPLWLASAASHRIHTNPPLGAEYPDIRNGKKEPKSVEFAVKL